MKSIEYTFGLQYNLIICNFSFSLWRGLVCEFEWKFFLLGSVFWGPKIHQIKVLSIFVRQILRAAGLDKLSIKLGYCPEDLDL